MASAIAYVFCKHCGINHWHVFFCNVILLAIYIFGLHAQFYYPTISLILLALAMLVTFYYGEIGNRSKRQGEKKLLKALDQSEIVRSVRDRVP